MAPQRPALTPGDPQQVARHIASVLETLCQHLADQQAAVLTALHGPRPRPAQLRTALKDFKQGIADLQSQAENLARTFAEQQVPVLYQQGAQHAADAVGQRMAWNRMHTQALQQLAQNSYRDMLARLQETQRQAEAVYRQASQAGRRDVPLLRASKQARQSATAAAQRLATERQLTHVVYRGGARVPVGVWAETAALTQSQVAYNAGVLNRAHEAGITAVQVVDGPGCGWTSHRDPDKAAGTVRTIQDAAGWPISHPRCTRTFQAQTDLAAPTTVG